QLSEDILSDVKEIAARYGVSILRADVKDLVFPGNLQEIMNRVLTAERLSEARLVEARTDAETSRIKAEADAVIEQQEAKARAEAIRFEAEAEAVAQKLKTEGELAALGELEKAAKAYTDHPALLRLRELDALRELAQSSEARIYIGFKKHADDED
ncbi:MAG: SPFH domain-containing protein, partial [Pseudomonadota bacterium]